MGYAKLVACSVRDDPLELSSQGNEQDRIKGPLSFDLFQYRLSAQMTDGGKKWSAVFVEKVFEEYYT